MAVRKSTIFGVVALILWGVVLTAGVTVYVYSEPKQLAALAAEYLSADDSAEVRIGQAHLGLFPRPHVRLEEVEVEREDAQTTIREATIFMGWKSLFQLQFIPGRIDIDHPTAFVRRKSQPQEQPLAQTTGVENPNPKKPSGLSDVQEKFSREMLNSLLALPAALPERFRDMRVSITDGELTVEDEASGTVWNASGLTGALRLPGLFSGSMDIGLKHIVAEKDDTHIATAIGVRLHAQGIDLPDSAKPKLSFDAADMHATLTVPGVFNNMTVLSRFVIENTGGSSAIRGMIGLEGEIMKPSSLFLNLQVPFSMENGRIITFQDARFGLDKDSLTFDGSLDLGAWALGEQDQSAPEPKLSGTANVARLSLPQWFSFARLLPVGIENALDDLSGRLEFTLTPAKLEVPKLEAKLKGIEFSGTGGVDDFSSPVIRIKAHTAMANVNDVFPELIQKTPPPFTWSSPPLVGDDQDDTPAPDYDIHLTADRAKVWKYDTTKFAFRLTPLPNGSRLNIDAGGFYEGSVTSVVDIEDDIRITSSFTNVASEKPITILTGKPLLRGLSNGRSALRGNDDSFDEFLATLSGHMEFDVAHGSIGTGDNEAQHYFDSLNAKFDFQGESLGGKKLPKELPYTGTWNLHMRTEDWEGALDMKGTAMFDSDSMTPLRFTELPGTFRYSNPHQIHANGTAIFSLDIAKDTLAVRNAQGKTTGGSFTGNLSVARLSGKTTLSGTGSLNTTSLRAYMHALDIQPSGLPKNAFQRLQAQGAFTVDENSVSFSQLRGKVDDISFAGSLSHTPKGQYAWQSDMRLGTVDMASYVQKNEAGSRQGGKIWEPGLLRGLTAKGTLAIDKLIISKLVHSAVQLPYTIEKNALVCKPVAFTPYGGEGEAEIYVEDTSDGYKTTLRYAVRNADSASFSRSFGLETILGGKAYLKTEIQGMLRQESDIPRELNGSWAFAITDGYVAERKSDGSHTKTMDFSTISAQGSLRKGVMRAQDFNLKSPTLAARGKGNIDLVAWTLDWILHVSTMGLTNIPVTYTGSLDAPERKIDTLNVMTGAIGRLGSGVWNGLEKILSLPSGMVRR